MTDPEALAHEAFDPELVRAWEPIGLDECLERFDFDRTNPERRDGTELRWYTYCQILNHLFEYPTQELVAGLAGHLATIAEDVRSQAGETFRLLEVAAGQGRLTVALSQELERAGIEHHALAVDKPNMYEGWVDVPGISKNIDAEDAAKMFLPHAIVGAWLPPYDWTPTFRSLPTVQQYIFLGQPEQHGTAGIWGYKPEVTNYRYTEMVDEPEYKEDGFERVDLTDLQPVQLCWSSRTGSETSMHPSKTISFKRVS